MPDECTLQLLDGGVERLVQRDRNSVHAGALGGVLGSTAAYANVVCQIVDANHGSRLAKSNKSPHFAGQLADVSGPATEKQRFKRLVAQGESGLAGLTCVALEIELGERRDFLAPLAQRRDVN